MMRHCDADLAMGLPVLFNLVQSVQNLQMSKQLQLYSKSRYYKTNKDLETP